jgi:hypothetical protein
VHDLAQGATGGGGQGAGGVAQVMHTQALDADRPGGRLPDAAVEVAAPQVPALAAEEHEGIGGWRGVVGQVLGQDVNDGGGEGDGAAPGGALGWADRECAVDLHKLLGHRHDPALQVDAPAA